ncbi:hypothetical protein CYY_004816 [Polysphondylium violaceum]|uniref:Uncharacterized protein n=1 Tax=Polysphondylium violaceum TaxID=133409 RepID=A0A8J4Q4N0_9MYCE|nr:hypothetical protein CYY_004816 [Polysphondylium violaceum]
MDTPAPDVKSKRVVKTAAERAQEKADSLKKTLRSVDWRDLTPIGFEFGTWESMKKEKWEFENLEHELQEGVLSDEKHPYYMFMGAQPIVENKVAYNMPYIVVIDCQTPPPSTVCKASIQGGGEEIFPMEQFHLKWSPYIRSKYVSLNVGARHINYPLITLNLQERAGKRVSEEKAKNLEYLLPYIRLPQISEKLTKQEVKSVSFPYKAKLSEEKAKELLKARKDEKDTYDKAYEKWKSEPKSKKVHAPVKPGKEEPCIKGEDGAYYKVIEMTFDKSVDTLTDFIPEFIDDNGLDAKEGDNIKAALKKAFEEKRKVVDEKFNQMLAEVAAYSNEQREDYLNIKVYKFYPTHPVFKVSQYIDPMVNRFFGKATETFPKPSNKVDLSKLEQLDEKTLRKIEEDDAKKEEEAKKKREAAAAKAKKETKDVEMEEAESEEEEEKKAESESEEEEEEEEKKLKATRKPTAAKGKKSAKSTKVSKTKEAEEPKAKGKSKSSASKKVANAKKTKSK